MIKKAAFKAYCRQYEARIAASEGKLQALKSGLKLTETCIRSALIENDPGVKQWLLWHCAHALSISESQIQADFGTEPAPSHPIWREFTELVSGPKQPKLFLIRQEEHPLHPGRSLFRVYAQNMQPLCIGRETVEEAETELKKSERVSSLTILRREQTSLRCSVNTVPHDCNGAECPCQKLLPDGYRIYESYGQWAPMKCIGNDWLFFPSDDGLLLVTEKEKARWYKRRKAAVDFIDRYVADEEANIDEGAMTESGPSPEVLARPAAFDPSRWR